MSVLPFACFCSCCSDLPVVTLTLVSVLSSFSCLCLFLFLVALTYQLWWLPLALVVSPEYQQEWDISCVAPGQQRIHQALRNDAAPFGIHRLGCWAIHLHPNLDLFLLGTPRVCLWFLAGIRWPSRTKLNTRRLSWLSFSISYSRWPSRT